MERELDTRDSVRVVTANNFLKASNLENISLKARKLLYLAIAQCRQDDKEFYTYKVTATEFADLMGIQVSHVYLERNGLRSSSYLIPVSMKKVFSQYNWIKI